MIATTIHAGIEQPATALVHLDRGQPLTDSLAIAKEFQRRHDNVLLSIDALIGLKTISRLDFKERDYKDVRGKKQRMIELTERGALIAMPFIGGRNSRLGQVRLVDAFLALRSERLETTHYWKDQRRQLAASYRVMSDALHEVRADDGKTTQPHHYANEARLLNWVMYGKFESVDRNHLSPSDLATLEMLEARNAIWIARGRTYEDRKTALPKYLQSVHTTLSVRLQ